MRGSKPEGARTIRPVGSTISIGGVGVGETASRSTTCTGRKTGAASVAHPRSPSRHQAPIAAGQLLPPPPEGPVLQPLSQAEVADREPAALLIPDRPPPELLPGGVASFATAFGHDRVPSARKDWSEGIVPWPGFDR